jgi:hypothetical protein
MGKNHPREELPLPVVFLLLIEVAARWRRSVPRTRRLLTRAGVPVYRLSGSNDLYKLSDIEGIENASRLKAPKPGNQAWITDNPSKRKYQKEVT